MKTIAFINQKGGVGKSICAFNIGAILSKVFNKKVLFIDLDPQATLTDFLILNLLTEVATNYLLRRKITIILYQVKHTILFQVVSN